MDLLRRLPGVALADSSVNPGPPEAGAWAEAVESAAIGTAGAPRPGAPSAPVHLTHGFWYFRERF